MLEQARKALVAEDYAAAEELSLSLIGRQGPSASALLVAGEAAAKQGRFTDALGYYAQLPEDAGREAAAGFAAAGEILLRMRRASAAEMQFRKALALDSGLLFAHERLGYLLGIEGRRWESFPHLFALLRADRLSKEMLILLGNHAAAIDRSEELRQFREAAPDDPMPLVGQARLAIRRTQMREAKQWLNEVLAQAPGQVEAQAELGHLLWTEADPEFNRWLIEAAPGAEVHPDIWMTRGLWAKQQGQTRGAARCFWEAIRRDPDQQAATYHLAQTLQELGDSQAAQRLSDRAARLQRLAGLMDLLYLDPGNVAMHREAAALTESLGRIWEACAWNQAILQIDSQDAESRQSLERLSPQLRERTPQVLDSHNPAKQIDLSDFALPRWDAELPPAKSDMPAPERFRAHFTDVAARAGIDFRYFPGREESEPGGRMYEFLGGGVAVLDYDVDGWPDIYLTQGCRWPPEAGQTEHLDRLYRNRGDGTFEDVTALSHLAEDRFSQGAAAGDFNNDGFCDLYVANIGGNRLYVNQGDGTFRDATAEAGLDQQTWTASALLADLSGDGLPDIYDVNYVDGPDVFDKICPQQGKPRICAPTFFQAQPDSFYLNLGDGRFAERTEAAGFNAAGGNGLGVVAGDLDGAGRLSLFVANDQDANFFFINNAIEPFAAPQFVERGVLSGLAYDGDGKALACMGVAAGDADGDGKLDLFVTNFHRESNTLYLQDSDGMFVDATAASGLREASYRMLGFGTQFIDGELDGYPDLVLTNGHIDDLSSEQIRYKMPPQYFRGLGRGKFRELPADELGAFFRGEYLGRGLARTDFNRDGREDFVVTDLHAPVALVVNDSRQTGHYLAVQLRGVNSARDAIGARVTIDAGGRSCTQWLTGGDGYQASNQRQLVFGLGDDVRVEKLRIRWPSGLLQQFDDIAVDQALLFIEGSPRVGRQP